MSKVELQDLLIMQGQVDHWFEGPLVSEAERQFPDDLVSEQDPVRMKVPYPSAFVKSKRRWWMFWRRLQALGSEVKELEAEVPWKWWKPLVPDTQKVLEELIDVLFFFLSLCNTLGLTAEDIQREYKRKYDINRERAIKLGHIQGD